MQTIFRVVGDPDRVFLGVVGDHTQNGAEDLFLSDRHVVLHVYEYRGLNEVPRFETFRMTLTTRENLRAFFDAFADIRLYSFVLFLRHHRSNGSLGISRITDGESAHRFAYVPLYFVEATFRHEEARPGSAGLS